MKKPILVILSFGLALLLATGTLATPVNAESFSANNLEEPIRWNEKAEVKITGFVGYNDPFTRRSWETLTQIHNKFGDAVGFEFRNFPHEFQDPEYELAIAGECVLGASTEKEFFEFSDKIMALSLDNRINGREATGIAKEMGVDISDCVKDKKFASEVLSDKQEGEEKGVRGTPTFFINERRIDGAQPYKAFYDLIIEELGTDAQYVKTASAGAAGAIKATPVTIRSAANPGDSTTAIAGDARVFNKAIKVQPAKVGQASAATSVTAKIKEPIVIQAAASDDTISGSDTAIKPSLATANAASGEGAILRPVKIKKVLFGFITVGETFPFGKKVVEIESIQEGMVYNEEINAFSKKQVGDYDVEIGSLETADAIEIKVASATAIPAGSAIRVQAQKSDFTQVAKPTDLEEIKASLK